MKKELTIEQKAKRYDYFEKAILDCFEKRIADLQYDEGMNTSRALDIILQAFEDVVPESVFLLLDKILDENYGCFQSQKRCCVEYLRNRYFEFEKEIGEKNDRTDK